MLSWIAGILGGEKNWVGVKCGIPLCLLTHLGINTLSSQPIELRGVEVHNLKKVDLDIPRQRLVVFCGVSGSGKSSLALDTLYAEGQRRYIESFSPYTRQFLEQLEKPAAERIDGIPPAISVTRRSQSQNSRSTIGTATETVDYLRLLFAKIGRVFCQSCSREITKETPQSVTAKIQEFPDAARFMITFSVDADAVHRVREDGFVRGIVHRQTVEFDSQAMVDAERIDVVVDRLAVGKVSDTRLRDSLETAFEKGEGHCVVFIEGESETSEGSEASEVLTIDGRPFRRMAFSKSLRCDACDIDYPTPEPRLYSFNSPLGACPDCEGFGNIVDIDMDLVVPNRMKTLREGAIAPWNSPSYAHELEELLALASDYNLPVDVPFSQLSDEHLKLLHEGVPERDFGGLRGFFAWLEKRKYKMHLRVYLSRWRSYRVCETCHGTRLRDESLATLIGDKNIAQICQLKIEEAIEFFRSLALTDQQETVGRTMLEQVQSRFGYLDAVGLGYLTLDRTLRTLSGGEAQRVALTSALGSTLVNMLYVLDEPTVGLHPRDVGHLVQAITGLRDRGNTVVVTEHEEAMIQAADEVVEVGPEAGHHGGRIVFQGTVKEMCNGSDSLTGEYLMGRRGVSIPQQRRATKHGQVRVTGARGNNLQELDVSFPLGVLCLVTGVSGSGKSTLVQDTLYGALCQRKNKDCPKPLPFDDVFGDGQIDDVMLVDQNPIGRSGRSNPVTYVKAFDEIRSVFADTIEARTHNYGAGHFSFNVDGGRCSKCKGEGQLEIDMQFLADVYMRCDQCGGSRYRKEILAAKYRNRSIADVLELTVREAFSFFRGQQKVQAKLKRLIDVGLDYLRLGQPANTLSSGEAQRLKLAAYMSAAKRNRTLFILDEPTTGLHFADIVKLVDCFDALLAVGHSLIVVEHNLQLMKAADYIIDLGPGAADRGGQLVTQGTPEEVAECAEAFTGQFLKRALADEMKMRSA